MDGFWGERKLLAGQPCPGEGIQHLQLKEQLWASAGFHPCLLQQENCW
jgi:hypothetical protein